MITFILGFLIGSIATFLFYVKASKEINSKIVAEVLEKCVEKIKLHEWDIEKTIDYLNNASNKLRNRK